jgi:hypothetical protein
MRGRACSALVVVAVLAGCGTAPSTQQGAPRPPAAAPAPAPAASPAPRAPETRPPAPAAPAPAVTQSAAQRELAEGIQLYDAGDYTAAINKLGNSPEIPNASVEIQTTALKYLAFSFCVTRRTTQCRTQFEHAFKLDPAFDLAPAERGHPLWGPVFERGKRAHQTPPK